MGDLTMSVPPTREQLSTLVLNWLNERDGLHDSQLPEDARLEDDLDIDSLELMTLVVEIHRATGVDIGDARIAEVSTVGELLSTALLKISDTVTL